MKQKKRRGREGEEIAAAANDITQPIIINEKDKKYFFLWAHVPPSLSDLSMCIEGR